MLKRALSLTLAAALLAACGSTAKTLPSATPPPSPAPATATSVPPTATPLPPAAWVSPVEGGPAQAWPLNVALENPRGLNGLRTLGAAREGVLYAFDYATGLPAAFSAGASARPLEFMRQANYGFDISPAQTAWIGWGTFPTADQPSRLWLARPDGSEAHMVYERPSDGLPVTLTFDRWAADGQSFFFSQDPYGIGGYIPLSGASSLYRLWLSDNHVDTLVPYPSGGGGMLCLDDLYEPGMLLAHHCDNPAEIRITNLNTGAAVGLAAPAPTDRVGPLGMQVSEYRMAGQARFSPDGRRVAYSLIRGDPGAEQGWVAVGDAQTGASELAWVAPAGGLFQVIGWLNSGTLLLQLFSPAGDPPAVWQVAADGSQGAQLAPGSWVGLIP